MMKEFEDYINMKKNEVASFREKVNYEGAEVIKNIFDDECFAKILADGERVWKDETQSFTGYYFPFRWLFEYEEWDFINTNFGKLYDSCSKSNVLRNKLKNTKTNNLDNNMCAAFELKVICKFYYDKILVDIDHKMKVNKRNVDALIN